MLWRGSFGPAECLAQKTGRNRGHDNEPQRSDDVHNTGRRVDFKTTIHQQSKLLGHARLKGILDFDAVVQLAVVEVFGIDSDAARTLGNLFDVTSGAAPYKNNDLSIRFAPQRQSLPELKSGERGVLQITRTDLAT